LIAFCKVSDQISAPFSIIQGLQQEEDFGDGLLLGSDVYINQKSSYISTDLFIKSLIEHLLKH